jgi:tetratricopeptide (TPR) repeat protein
MNKVQLGHAARASYYEAVGNPMKAIEYYSKCTELPDVWRSLALACSDIDDLENSIMAFDSSVQSGDMKSLPWLVALLENYRPNDSQLPRLKKMLDEGVSQRNVDMIFSLGNLHLVAGEYQEALEFWSDYINQEHWIINRNIANRMLTRYLQLGEFIPAPLGPITTEAEALEFFMHVNEKAFKEGEPLGLVDLGTKYSTHRDLEIFEGYSPRDFYDSFIESSHLGHGDSLIMAIHFAGVFRDELPDDAELMQLVEEYGLSDFLEEVNYHESSDDLRLTVGARYVSASSNLDSKDSIQAIFDRADAAEKAGDSLGEVAAWLEGIELGDENCFYNLGVALCRELGIVQNFFGSEGGEGKVWSALAKGIGASEHRPGRGPIHRLNRTLSSNQINSVRSIYGGSPLVQAEALKPGHESSLMKVRDLFEKCGFIYTQIDENLIVLPFSSRNGSFILLCELIEDEGKDYALIYTCLLTSKFDKQGLPIGSKEGLSKVQARILEILVRDQEVIFPGMSMIDIGTIFNSIPRESAPNSFLNVTKSKEYWTIAGNSPASMFCEVLPTKHEYEKIEFGYGIDIALQSDHFETAIRAVTGSITGMLDLMAGMLNESEELFDLIFDYQTTTRFDFGKNFVENSKLAKLGSKTAQAIMVFEEKDQAKRLEKLLELSEGGLRVANRVMLDAVDLTKSNIDVIAKALLKDAELEENHPQIRDALNNVGWKYNEFGDTKKANVLFKRAANLGSGNALANLSWELLTSGDHEEARQVFEESYYRIMTTRETENDFEQGGNIRSNDALHRFALGAPHSELREIWEDSHHQENHLESRFYPIVLDHLEGNSEKVQTRLATFNKNERAELIEMFQSLVDGHHWIAGIAKTSLELLGEEPQKKKGLFRR